MGVAARIRNFMGIPDEDYYEQPEDGMDQAYDAPEEAAPRSSLGQPHQVVLAKPLRFEDASGIADHLSENHIVIMNLESTPKDVIRRLIDFLAGAAYAKDGQLKQVASGTFIITPFNVDFDGDELGGLGGILF